VKIKQKYAQNKTKPSIKIVHIQNRKKTFLKSSSNMCSKQKNYKNKNRERAYTKRREEKDQNKKITNFLYKHKKQIK